MANNIGSRSWLINTASASVIWQPQVFIKFIEVIVGTTAGTIGATAAAFTDRNGNPIVTAMFQTTNEGEVQTYNLENWFEGLICPTLATGVTALVHVK